MIEIFNQAYHRHIFFYLASLNKTFQAKMSIVPESVLKKGIDLAFKKYDRDRSGYLDRS